jgi:tyrosinase
MSDSPIFDPKTGFGGNGAYVPFNETQSRFGAGLFPGFTIPSNATGSNSTAPFSGFPAGSTPPFGGGAGGPPPGGLPAFNFTSTGGGCILSGPFANLTTHMGPSSRVTLNPRCVTRDFSQASFNTSGSRASVDNVLAQTYFGAMSQISESTVHGAGHGGVGGISGDMVDPWSSRTFLLLPFEIGKYSKISCTNS